MDAMLIAAARVIGLREDGDHRPLVVSDRPSVVNQRQDKAVHRSITANLLPQSDASALCVKRGTDLCDLTIAGLHMHKRGKAKSELIALRRERLSCDIPPPITL